MGDEDRRHLAVLWRWVRVGFLLCLLALTWWQVLAGEELGEAGQNPRNIWMITNRPRGGIFAAHGEVLAQSIPTGKGFARRYPVWGLTHTVGYLSPRYGATGLEKTYAQWLVGPRTWWYGLFGDLPRGEGGSLHTTIWLPVQKVATQVLEGKKGAVVALDPRTGAILAMASSPVISPEELERKWATFAANKDAPLLNRATMGMYPPGSTLKPLLVAAALQTGLATTESRYFCPGKRVLGGEEILCLGGAHGNLDLTRALEVSCNYVFSGLALQLGRERVKQALEAFGLGTAPPLDIPAAPGLLPPLEKESLRSLAEVGIGQGELLVTPLQMALVCAAIANGGRMMEPYLVEKIQSPEGKILWHHTPRLWRYPVTSSTARIVGGMMKAVVEEGTGTMAQLPGVKMAGKTGSAENPHGPPHAWFIGYAPADAPTVAVAVIVENGGLGGHVAAPLAAKVVQAVLERR